MARTYLWVSFLIVLASTLSCGEEKNKDSYLNFGNDRYRVNEAWVQHLDHETSAGYSRIAVTIHSKADIGDTYITLVLYRQNEIDSDNELFTYAYTPSVQSVSHVSLGREVFYDEFGQKIAGTIISETEADMEGTVSYRKGRSKTSITIDLKIDSPEGIIILRGEYSGEPEEGYVSY